MGQSTRDKRHRQQQVTKDITAALSREVRLQRRGRNQEEHDEIVQEAWAQLLVATGDVGADPTAAYQYVHTAVRHALRNHQAFRNDVAIVTWEKRVRLLRLRYLLAEAGIYATPQELAEISNGDDDPAAEARRRRQGRWIHEDEAYQLVNLRYQAEVDLDLLAARPVSEPWLAQELSRIASDHPRPQVRALAADLAQELVRCEQGQETRSPRQVALDRMPERTADRVVAELREALAPPPAEPHG